jgi:hypothetical protein
MKKKCSKCGLNLPLRSFAKMTASEDGLQPRCRQCHKAYRAYRRLRLSGASTEATHATTASTIGASRPTTSHPPTKQRRKRKTKQP